MIAPQSAESRIDKTVGRFFLYAEILICVAPALVVLTVCAALAFIALPYFSLLDLFVICGACALFEMIRFALMTVQGKVYRFKMHSYILIAIGLLASLLIAVFGWRALALLDLPLFLLGFHMLGLRHRLAR